MLKLYNKFKNKDSLSHIFRYDKKRNQLSVKSQDKDVPVTLGRLTSPPLPWYKVRQSERDIQADRTDRHLGQTEQTCSRPESDRGVCSDLKSFPVSESRVVSQCHSDQVAHLAMWWNSSVVVVVVGLYYLYMTNPVWSKSQISRQLVNLCSWQF